MPLLSSPLSWQQLGDAATTVLRSVAVQLLAREVGVTAKDLFLWNDAPGRTVEHVLDALDRAGREPEGGAS